MSVRLVCSIRPFSDILEFLAAGLPDPCDGALGLGTPLVLRPETRGTGGGLLAWLVLLEVRGADVVVG